MRFCTVFLIALAFVSTSGADSINYLKNGGFEEGANFSSGQEQKTKIFAGEWIWEETYAAPKECYTFSDKAKEGLRALKISVGVNDMGNLYRGDLGQLRQVLDLRSAKGKEIVLEGYYLVESPGCDHITFHIRQRTDAGKYLKPAIDAEYVLDGLETGKWHKFKVSGKIDESAVRADLMLIQIYDKTLFVEGKNSIIYYDGLSLKLKSSGETLV